VQKYSYYEKIHHIYTYGNSGDYNTPLDSLAYTRGMEIFT